MNLNSDPFIVQYVDFKYTDLVDEQNNFKKNMHIGEAKSLAKNAGLDLVCFKRPENDQLALCKIINFGKWKYNEEKQKKKQNIHRKQTKEMKFHPDIAEHDIEYKVRQINEFLSEDDDVLLYLILRGRQAIHFKDAEAKFNYIISLCNMGKEISRKVSEKTIIVRLVKNNTIGGIKQ